MTAMDPEREKHLEDSVPPVLGTWARIYLFVLGTLAFMVFSFHLFTQYFK